MPIRLNMIQVVQLVIFLSLTFLMSSCTIKGDVESSLTSLNLSLPDQNTIIVGQNYTIDLSKATCPCSIRSQSSNLTVNSEKVSATSAGSVDFEVTDKTGLSKSFTLTAVNPLGTGVAALTRVEQSATHQLTLTHAAIGGLGPYTFSIISGGGSVNSSGLYTAASATGTKVLRIRDSLNQTYDMNFDVYSIFTSTATAPSITTVNSTTISASGGYGSFTYSLVSGPGSVHPTTGVYTPAGAGVAVIRVTDAQGISRDLTVNVEASLALTTAATTIAANNIINMISNGGVSPLVYSIVSGGGSINASTGVFTPPIGGGVVIIRVTDAIGNVSDATITVNPALSISPSALTLAVGNSHTFAGINGVPPYTYSVLSGVGSIHTTTGVYGAPPGIGTDIIRVTDILLNTVDSIVSVVPLPTLSIDRPTIALNNTATVQAVNGVPPYVYSVASGGGGINSSTGVYTPASIGAKILQVTDAKANTATVGLTVNPALTISPINPMVQTSSTQSFSASGGVGSYVYSVFSGGVSGSINATTGLFSATTVPGSPGIRVTDSIGNTSDTTALVMDTLYVTISSHTQNFNLRSVLMGAPHNWNGTTPINIQVTVNAGIYVWSDSTSLPAFDTGSMPAGTTLVLNNNGYIMGKGGTGGAVNWNVTCTPPTAGGPAVSIQCPTTVSMPSGSSYIGGGGGGGGCSIAGNHASGGGGAGGGIGPHYGSGSSDIAGGAIGQPGNSRGGGGDDGSAGASGGRIFPGTGGAGAQKWLGIGASGGGAGGGGGGSNGLQEYPGGDGGAGGGAGGGATPPSAGGGGGWGASGGSGTVAGAPGGKAVNLNGNSITWSGGFPTGRVLGAVN